MSDAQLLRYETSDMGCFGRILCGSYTNFSGELPWLDNASSISCVLAGIYKVIWAYSPHLKKNTYRLVDVPGRAGILCHSANLFGSIAAGYKAQLLGCISLGTYLGYIGKQKALLNSITAVRRFEEYMQYKPFTLEIRNGFNN